MHRLTGTFTEDGFGRRHGPWSDFKKTKSKRLSVAKRGSASKHESMRDKEIARYQPVPIAKIAKQGIVTSEHRLSRRLPL